jgi:hypothetical protein
MYPIIQLPMGVILKFSNWTKAEAQSGSGLNRARKADNEVESGAL